MNPTTWLASGGIIGLFALAVTLTLALFKQWNAQQRLSTSREEALLHDIASARAETARVSADHRRCERRLNILFTACNEHGVTIPQSAWEEA